MTIKTVTATAQNTFSDPLTVGSQSPVDIAIDGTFTATVTVQRRRSDFNNNAWMDLPTTYDAPTQALIEPNGSNWEYRIGVKTGGFTSGTVTAALACR